MEPPFFLIPIFIAVWYLSGLIHTQDASSYNDTSVNDTDDGNRTRIRPYDKFRTIEMIRAQVLKKITLNSVCPPKKPAEGDEITITDMTVGARVGSENKNFEFAKIGQDQTFGNEAEVIESVTVSTPNQCVRKCAANKDCLAYAYEDNRKGCKLAKICKPSLTNDAGSQVFTMSYWYAM